MLLMSSDYYHYVQENPSKGMLLSTIGNDLDQTHLVYHY
jgi:hypothetical protein